MMAGLVLGLSACATTDKDTVDTDKVQSEQEDSKEPSASEETDEKEPEMTPEPSQEPEVTPEPEEEEPVVKAGDYLEVTFDYNYDAYYNERAYMQGHFATIRLHNAEYPALAEIVNTFNAAHAQTSQGYLDELEKFAVEDFAEYGEESFWGPYVFENDMYLRRGDSQVLSVMTDNYEYTGGAHGGRYFNGYNFEVQTGKEILLEDVIVDKSRLAQALTAELMEKYWEFEYTEDYWMGMLESYISDEPMEFKPEFTWTVEYDGVSFYFSNYELVTYAEGTQEVTLHCSEYPYLFNSRYFDSVEKNYVKNLTKEQWNAYEDIDGNGQTDAISVVTKYDEDRYCIESYTVNVNNYGYTFDTHAFELETYLVKAGEENYLYIQQTSESDWQCVNVYKITPDRVEYVGQFDGGMWSFTNSDSFKIIRRVDLLGTYSIRVECQLGENGMPVMDSKACDVDSIMTIYSTTEITADLIDKDGKLLGESYTFPAGSAFTFKRTDGTSYVDMQANYDQYCRFYVTPGWPVTVNGMDATECFEELFYAG